MIKVLQHVSPSVVQLCNRAQGQELTDASLKFLLLH